MKKKSFDWVKGPKVHFENYLNQKIDIFSAFNLIIFNLKKNIFFSFKFENFLSTFYHLLMMKKSFNEKYAQKFNFKNHLIKKTNFVFSLQSNHYIVQL